MFGLTLVMLSYSLVSDGEFSVVEDRPVPELAHGAALEETLAQHVSVRWSNVDIRTILGRLTDEYHIAILRDRRIDPDAIVSFSTTPKPAGEIVADVGNLAGGHVRFVGNTAYIGPDVAVRNLRTLIALRNDELAADSDMSNDRRRALSKSQTVHWQDLAKPAEIFQDIARQYDLTVIGGEQIPHDLWGGGTFVAEHATEALSLVLIQLDLTFRWRKQATTVEIVPIPATVGVIRRHSPGRMAAPRAAEMVRSDMPDLPLRVEAGKLVVQGTIEEHEAVERLLNPRHAETAKRPAPAGGDPLKNERMTLRVMGVPALALIKDLEKRYKMVFTYDADVLAAAGVDLEQKVDINVEKTTIDGYLTAFFSQIGARFERAGLRVSIQPAAKDH